MHGFFVGSMCLPLVAGEKDGVCCDEFDSLAIVGRFEVRVKQPGDQGLVGV